MKLTPALLIFGIILCSSFYVYVIAGYRRVCYYTNWSQYRRGLGRYLPNNTDPFLCTHIIFAFAKIDRNELASFEENDYDLYKEINKLKVINPNLKTLLAVGGWNQASTNFSAMVSKTNKMNKFIVKSVAYLRHHGFDGLDVDWEFPTLRNGANATTDKHNFAMLCKNLHLAYDREARRSGKERLLVTIAVSSSKRIVDVAYEVPTLARYVDFISLMTYDFHGGWKRETGHHSLLYARQDPEQGEGIYLDIDWAARYWVLLGASKEQINIGLSIYGRGFTLKDPNDHTVGAPAKGPNLVGPYTSESGYLAYYEICLMLTKGGTTYWDTGEPYYVKGDQWIGFDNEESISEKVSWLVSEGYGGAMVWALPLDDFNQVCSLSNRKFPLLQRIKDDLVAAEVMATTEATPTSTDGQLPIFDNIV